MKKPTRILFLVPSPPGISPGQRFRFEHYLPDLEKAGIRYKISPFLSLKSRRSLYSRGRVIVKIWLLTKAYGKRVKDLFSLHKYDYVYIHRWVTTAGPPLFEWIIARVYRKKIIYDFDDSIWVSESAYHKKFLAVKFLGKVSRICKWSYKITVGNNFLRSYAQQFNQNVIVMPTVVNTETVHGQLQNQSTSYPAVGWTGSFSTLIYLEKIIPVISRLQEKHDFIFYVIADKDPKPNLKNYTFIPWHRETESWDLLKFHIGLMPLPDDDITRGKCGFKAIQYMSLGIPAIVSPVGVNTEIVSNEKDGFVCDTDREWEQVIEKLLSDSQLREKIGKAARGKIETAYSVQATREKFLSLFR